MGLNVTNLLSVRLDTRKSQWEDDFSKNMDTFSAKISEGIAKKFLEKLSKTLADPYKELPNKKSPLSSSFSFEIVKPEAASSLKELAQETANLPPFKEWFERFCIVNQKVSQEDDLLDSSSGPLGVKKPEMEKGIERDYFLDMMALVGQAVESRLKSSFKSSNSEPGNLGILKIEVKWYRQSDQLIPNPSNFHDNSIDVLAWIEQKQTQNQIPSTTASLAMEKERVNRKRSQFVKGILFNTAPVIGALAVLILGVMVMPAK